LLSVVSEDVTGVNLVLHIVEGWVISVGDDA